MSLVYLFTPGDSRIKLEKAAGSDTDVVIIDLEDGVSAADKTFARQQTYAFLEEKRREASRNKPFVIRCNPANSPHFAEDMRLVRECGVVGVMIPKCEGAEELRAANEAAPLAELIPLIESARGVQQMEEIGTASDRIGKVAFGAVDFALDIGAGWSESGEERLYAMGRIVLLSRVAGLEPPIDAVFPLLDAKESFIKDAKLGKQVGFYGKMIIHPRHIEWVRDAYQIPKEELEWCRNAVRLYESMPSGGSVKLDGKLIDMPVYVNAKRRLGALTVQQEGGTVGEVSPEGK
ncbi:CoA ester lyase [Paenibacillus sp. GYB004]|uniref:HpcH/HpaI aldolase/citrate lyase family protein n=1 Tax=Paenibacillus sp. GYB004 TaxID=2994393 RepID=UPI002F96CEB5